MADAHNILLEIIFIIKNVVLLILPKLEKRYSQEETKVLNERKECEVYVIKRSLELFRKKVLLDRNVYLMTELLQDVHEVSLENGLQVLL